MKLFELTNKNDLTNDLKERIAGGNQQRILNILRFNILDYIVYLQMDISIKDAENAVNNAIKIAKQDHSLQYQFIFEVIKYNILSTEGRIQDIKKSLVLKESILKKIHNPVLESSLLLCKGAYYGYYNPKEKHKAEKYFKSAVRAANKGSNEFKIFQANNNLMAYYLNEHNYQKAQKLAEKLLNHRLFKLRNRTSLSYKAILLNNLGAIYIQEKRLEKALHYFKRSAKIQHKIGDYNKEKRCKGNIGSIYFSQRQYNKAIQVFKELLKSTRSIEYFGNRMVCLKNLGICYVQLKRYQEALKYYRQLEKLALKYQSYSRYLETIVLISFIYFRQKSPKKIKNILKKLDEYSSELNQLDEKRYRIALNLMVEILENKRNGDEIIEEAEKKYQNDSKITKELNQIKEIFSAFHLKN